jgi:hypothetical protein
MLERFAPDTGYPSRSRDFTIPAANFADKGACRDLELKVEADIAFAVGS